MRLQHVTTMGKKPDHLSRLPTMRDRVQECLSQHPNELVSLFNKYVAFGKRILQPHEIVRELETLLQTFDHHLIKEDFGVVLQAAQEAIVCPPWVALAIRPKPGVWEYVRVNVDELTLDELIVSEYLQFKELLVEERAIDPYVLAHLPLSAPLPPSCTTTCSRVNVASMEQNATFKFEPEAAQCECR